MISSIVESITGQVFDSGMVFDHILKNCNMKKSWIVGCLLCVSWSVLATKPMDHVANYLDSYKEIAIDEMRRTGIPASIKLAQGMLESNWGRSTLAVSANNHFGIKCGGSWTGDEYYREDDDTNRKGDIIPSCFRVYSDARESYVAHSNFLADSRKKNRYGFLFDLPQEDYRAWAKGLRKAGYATDPKYPSKLISLIEKYDLDQYDIQLADVVEASKAMILKQNTSPTDREVVPKESYASSSLNVKDESMFGLKCWSPSQPVGVESLSRMLGVSAKDIIKYNDHISDQNQQIPASVPVFVEPKLKKYKGDVKTHTVLEGETIESISQKYGVQVTRLRFLNRIARSSTPVVGEIINLQSKNKSRVAAIRNKRPQIIASSLPN